MGACLACCSLVCMASLVQLALPMFICSGQLSVYERKFVWVAEGDALWGEQQV